MLPPASPLAAYHASARPQPVGHYARVQQLATPTAAPTAAPKPPARPLPVAQAATAPGGDILSRLIAWLKQLFSPRTAPPPTPAPPGPTPPSTGASARAFFTNTYASPTTGMTNEQVNHANEASAQADPNNPDRQLVAMIDAIQPGGTLDGAFFDIEAPNVVDAFARAAQRGVRVRLVTEENYYLKPESQRTPDDPATPQDERLRAPIQKLLAAGVSIKADDRSPLMHDKFLVANGQTVWTGSYNITGHGGHRENNNAIRFESSELARQFSHEFEKMYTHGNFGLDTDNGNPLDDHPEPKTVQVGNAQVTTYFSPSKAAQAGAKGALMAEIAAAQKSVQFLAFSYTDDEMGDLMLQKAQAGVKVEGVFEKSQAASRYSEYQKLNPQEAALGGRLDVRIDTNPALMHHKVVIIDDSTLVMGSFNFSASAQSDNDENMLVIKNAPDLVAAYKAEFERIQKISIE